MAILRIFRPALACLLLLLALSQEAPQEAPWKAPQEAPQDAPRDAKKGAKCKNPNGSEGDWYTEGCYKFTCVKASKKSGIWVETPALDICCVQNATLFPTGTIIQESMPNDYTLVLLKCEQLEYYYPSIVPEVYNINPPLENIEEKLEQLCYKTEEILEAVQDCSEYEDEQVILIAGGYSVELYNPKTGFSCFITQLPDYRFAPVASGLNVCGGGESSCLSFEPQGSWAASVLLVDPRMGSIGWNSSQAGLVLIGGVTQPDTAESGPKHSQNIFNIYPQRSYGCGIPDYDSIVLTGGYDPDDNIQLSSVQRYDLNGFVENLPSLNEAREIHGCGCYYNNDGEKVFLVAGGFNSNSYYYYDSDSDSDLSKKDRSHYYSTYDYYYYSTNDYSNSGFLSSTEIWIPGWDSWKYADPLPKPVAGAAHVSHVSHNNNIYLLGNYAGYETSNTVYEWKGETEKWELQPWTLLEDVAFAGATTVPVSSGILDYCQEYVPYSTYGPYMKKDVQPNPWEAKNEAGEKRGDQPNPWEAKEEAGEKRGDQPNPWEAKEEAGEKRGDQPNPWEAKNEAGEKRGDQPNPWEAKEEAGEKRGDKKDNTE